MFHPATKLVVITEHFISNKVCKIIEAGGGKGYTMVPAGGKGLHHLHPTMEKATVVEGFDNIKFEVIMQDRQRAEAIANRVVNECFDEYPGVMYLEDIQVCRPERF
jgi:nitrogen regulatory protein PII